MALVVWFGTLLGTLAMSLTLTTVPATWTTHHHAVYVLLWVAAIACLLITACVPLWYGLRWAFVRWWVWHAARNYNPEAVIPQAVMPTSPTGERSFIFQTTNEPSMLVMTGARPVGLRITKPFEAHVWAGHLPVRVQRRGKTIFRVTQFLPNGFTIEDQCRGIRVEGEISYSDLAPAPGRRR